LVGPTAALAAQRHRKFAAREDHRAPPLRLEIAGQSCLRGGDLARHALDRGAEQDALVSSGVRRILPRAEGLGGPGGPGAPGGGGGGGGPGARGWGVWGGGGGGARAGGGERGSRWRATMARASVSVVRSGTVGPEPITVGSSPGTSEMPTATRRAGYACCASR